MLMILSQLVLFFTAVTASRKCAARGYRTRGLVAFVVLEVAYLLMGMRVWFLAGIMMAAGCWIVIHCINLPQRNTRTDLAKP